MPLCSTGAFLLFAMFAVPLYTVAGTPSDHSKINGSASSPSSAPLTLLTKLKVACAGTCDTSCPWYVTASSISRQSGTTTISTVAHVALPMSSFAQTAKMYSPRSMYPASSSKSDVVGNDIGLKSEPRHTLPFEVVQPQRKVEAELGTYSSETTLISLMGLAFDRCCSDPPIIIMDGSQVMWTRI